MPVNEAATHFDTLVDDEETACCTGDVDVASSSHILSTCCEATERRFNTKHTGTRRLSHLLESVNADTTHVNEYGTKAIGTWDHGDEGAAEHATSESACLPYGPG